MEGGATSIWASSKHHSALKGFMTIWNWNFLIIAFFLSKALWRLLNIRKHFWYCPIKGEKITVFQLKYSFKLLKPSAFPTGIEFYACCIILKRSLIRNSRCIWNQSLYLCLGGVHKLRLQDLSFFDHLPPSIYIFYGIKVYKKSIFLTTYPPPIVNVVCERPLILKIKIEYLDYCEIKTACTLLV